MEVNSIADVKLIGRALNRGWLANNPEKLQEAVTTLFDIVQNGMDDEIRIKAFQALVKADATDLKREEVALKKQALDDARRFRLLELVRNLPPGVLAKLAPGDAGSAES